jgi:hypothetical protein
MPRLRQHGFSPEAIARVLAGDDDGERVYTLWNGAFLKVGKVGRQRHPIERLKDLQTGSPYPLRLLAWTWGKEFH